MTKKPELHQKEREGQDYNWNDIFFGILNVIFALFIIGLVIWGIVKVFT